MSSLCWKDAVARLNTTCKKITDVEQSRLAVEESLDFHCEMEVKQNQALDNQAAIIDQDRRIASSLDDTRRSMDRHFDDVNEMAKKQKLLLAEMFGTLQESVRYLMSLFLIEFVGYETFAVFVASLLVILFLPRFGYSRFKLYLLLFGELVVEVIVRRLFGYLVLGGGAGSRPPPEAMVCCYPYTQYSHV